MLWSALSTGQPPALGLRCSGRRWVRRLVWSRVRHRRVQRRKVQQGGGRTRSADRRLQRRNCVEELGGHWRLQRRNCVGGLGGHWRLQRISCIEGLCSHRRRQRVVAGPARGRERRVWRRVEAREAQGPLQRVVKGPGRAVPVQLSHRLQVSAVAARVEAVSGRGAELMTWVLDAGVEEGRHPDHSHPALDLFRGVKRPCPEAASTARHSQPPGRSTAGCSPYGRGPS